MIIGITGKYCAGKNHISAIFEKRGFKVLDADKLGYQVLETEKETIFTQFGHDLKKNDGSLDRRLLGQRVFGKPKNLEILESIVHPAANRLTEKWISAQNGKCVINAALLHKTTIYNKLNVIILVTAPFLTRFIRARKRDKLPWIEIFKRFASQKNFNNFTINANANSAEIYKVENSVFANTVLTNQALKLERQIDKIIEGIS